MNFLFWNIRKSPRCYQVIVDAVKAYEVDVLALAEFPVEIEETNKLLVELQKVDEGFKYLKPMVKEKIVVFYNSTKTVVENKHNTNKIIVKSITSKYGEMTAFVVFCHLVSKVNATNEEQAENAVKVRRDIEDFENDNVGGKEMTLVCGDFNMNPFEPGMVKAMALNAVMERRIAKQKLRKIDGEEYRFFYNPMWGFLGDTGTGEVSGTFYYNGTRHIQYFWNVYDQVLLRPEAIDYFEIDALRILTKTPHFNLLTSRGLVNKNDYSDHLPIYFKLNI